MIPKMTRMTESFDFATRNASRAFPERSPFSREEAMHDHERNANSRSSDLPEKCFI